MKLVERERQLGALRRLFASCKAGSSGIAVVSGVVASGKTALLQAFIDETERNGAVILRANADQAEAAQPLGVVGQMISNATSMASNDERARLRLDIMKLAMPSLQVAVANTATGPAVEIGDAVYPQILTGFAETLFELGETNCVVICVDDAHHADPHSLEFLLHLARRLRSKPARILIVLSERIRPKLNHPKFYAELIRHHHYQHFQLSLLSQAGITELLAHELGVELARSLAPACHALTGGNPLLIHGLLEDYRASDRYNGGELTPGDAFGRAVSACLYRSDRTMLETAQAISVIQQYASGPVLAEFLGTDSELLKHNMRALESAGLLLSGEFRHVVARQAAVADLGATERANMHAEAARVLYEHGMPVTVVAEHLLAAGDIKYPWMAAVVREVAEQALNDNRTQLAIECLRLCGQVAYGADERITIKAALARAEWRVNPAKSLRHLPELTTAAMEGRLNGDETKTLLTHLLWFGQVDQALAVIDELERTNPAVFADTSQVRRLFARSYPGRSRGLGQFYVSEPGRYGHTDSMSRYLGFSLEAILRRGADGQTLSDVERILQGLRVDDHTVMTAASGLAMLVRIGRLEEVADWCDVLITESEDRQCLTWQALFEAIRATIYVRQGRMAEAEVAAHTALTHLPPEGWGVVISLPLAAMLRSLTARGNYEKAGSYLNVPIPEAMFETVGVLPYLQARGRYYLATKRPYAALKDFETCSTLTAAWGVDTLDSWRADAASAWLSLGRPYLAQQLITEQLARTQPRNFAVRGVCLRVVAAMADMRQRPAILREAVELLQESGDRYEAALTLAELGRTYHLLGDQRHSRGTIRVAEHLAEANGFEIPLDDMSPATDRGAADVGPDARMDIEAIAQLSGAELRVAVLAAQGRSNRQIADEFFITVSTVEQHLTRVYRKLKVNRRSDLLFKLRSATSTSGHRSALSPEGPRPFVA